MKLSLATPEMNYRWDTNDCDLEHSHFALDGVKRARDRSLSIVLSRCQRRVARDRAGAITRVFAIQLSDDENLVITFARADTPPQTRACERNTTRECISRSSGLENVVTQ